MMPSSSHHRSPALHRRVFFPLWFALVLLLLISFSALAWGPAAPRAGAQNSAACAAVRIMPLGDSITYGTGSGPVYGDSGTSTGYRQALYRSLVNAGYNVNFVGSQATGQLATPAFDVDHEGHPGWSANQVRYNVYTWLQNNPADVVLLHIGTNALQPTSTVTDVESILDEIDRFNPQTLVILARIINQDPTNSSVTTFNTNLQTMANQRIANGDNLVVVNMESALSYPGDLYNRLHPNDSGYAKMAAVWFTALQQHMPACGGTASPTPTQGTPVPTPVGSGSVLLVVRSTTLNAGDAALRSRLQGLGFSVTLVNQDQVSTAQADGRVLVFISETVSSTRIGTTFRDVAVPVIVAEGGLFDDMAMTGPTSDLDYGLVYNFRNVTMTGSTHPLAAGLNGLVEVTYDLGTMAWGVPNANAIRVATIPGASNRSAVFGYDSGAGMVGRTAAARRVGLFLMSGTPADLTPAGYALLDAAVAWATGNTGGTPPTATHTATATNATATATATRTATATATATTGGGATLLATPLADVRVSSTFPDVNYGTGTQLQLRRSGSEEQEAYLSFALSGANGPIQRAVLRLFADGNGTVDAPALYPATGTLDQTNEATVTWDTRPTRGTSIAANVARVNKGDWAEYDVTSLVNGNGVYLFALAAESDDGVYFASLQYTTEVLRPQLVVTLANGSVTTATPTASTATTATATASPTATSAATTATATASPTATSAAATTRSFAPAADAQVTSAAPGTNYGDATTLRALSSSSEQGNIYLQFVVTGVSGPIQQARLRLYATNGTVDGPNVQTTSEAWSESGANGITWNNRPAPSGTIIANSGQVRASAWTEYDVTSVISGDGTYTLVLVGENADGVTFAARESSTPPQLVLTLAPTAP